MRSRMALSSATSLSVLTFSELRNMSRQLIEPPWKRRVGFEPTADGCLRYDAYESTTIPGTSMTVEEWRDQAALDAHLSSPELQDILAHADRLFVGRGFHSPAEGTVAPGTVPTSRSESRSLSASHGQSQNPVGNAGVSR